MRTDGRRRLAAEAFDEVVVAAAAERRAGHLARRVEALEDDAGVVVETARGRQRDGEVLADAEVLGASSTA